jgi:hypothetical protein
LARQKQQNAREIELCACADIPLSLLNEAVQLLVKIRSTQSFSRERERDSTKTESITFVRTSVFSDKKIAVWMEFQFETSVVHEILQQNRGNDSCHRKRSFTDGRR